jgi:DNA polymerase-3 subunit alpha
VTRLREELDIIEKLDFLDYFLIVADIISYCKKNKILTGPGRGSASGSLVVYLLDITEVDPIKYGLYFERFLNPERISPPDIDFDVEQGRRQEVLAYIKERFGNENVVQIGTIGRMGVKDTIRRVGKALGIDLKTIVRINNSYHIDDGTRTQDISTLHSKAPEVIKEMQVINADWVKYCEQLCNLSTSFGVHAAGVVISDRGLADVPLAAAGREKKQEDVNIITQYDMHVLEKMGHVKFDLLGLKSLDVIHETIKYIKRNGNSKFKDERSIYDESVIPLDDEKTYELITSGNTTGVFQLEGEGFKGLCRSLQPESFDQIAALNALYRPGPIGSGVLDEYVERRHGRGDVVYDFPEMENITNYTFGLCLYQEQLMRLAVEVAGYTLPQADSLRKIIGKKLVEKIEEEGRTFVERGLKFGRYDEDRLVNAYDIIKPAGRYSWNLSHAVAYGYITYIMAHLKTHYPVEFYTASLNLSIGDPDRMSVLIRDAIENNIEVVGPNVNLSAHEFDVVDDKIVYGLHSIKGVGATVAQAIIETRDKDGPFDGLQDFFVRVPQVKCNAKHKEALVKAGAFDGIDFDNDYNRATMLNAIPALTTARKMKRYTERTIRKRMENARVVGDEIMVAACEEALTGEISTQNKYVFYEPISKVEIEEVPEWSSMELYQNEVSVLGTSLSIGVSDVIADYLRWLHVDEYISIEKSKEYEIGWKIMIAGLCTRIHKIKTKTDRDMGFMDIDDGTGQRSVVVFPELWDMRKPVNNVPYLVVATIDWNKDHTEKQLIGQDLIALDGNIAAKSIVHDNNIDAERIIRVEEFGKFHNFGVRGREIYPLVGNNFKVTLHVGYMLDILLGYGHWEMEA